MILMVVNMSRFDLIIFICLLHINFFTCIRTIIQKEYFLVIEQLYKIPIKD